MKKRILTLLGLLFAGSLQLQAMEGKGALRLQPAKQYYLSNTSNWDLTIKIYYSDKPKTPIVHKLYKEENYPLEKLQDIKKITVQTAGKWGQFATNEVTIPQKEFGQLKIGTSPNLTIKISIPYQPGEIVKGYVQARLPLQLGGQTLPENYPFEFEVSQISAPEKLKGLLDITSVQQAFPQTAQKRWKENLYPRHILGLPEAELQLPAVIKQKYEHEMQRLKEAFDATQDKETRSNLQQAQEILSNAYQQLKIEMDRGLPEQQFPLILRKGISPEITVQFLKQKYPPAKEALEEAPKPPIIEEELEEAPLPPGKKEEPAPELPLAEPLVESRVLRQIPEFLRQLPPEELPERVAPVAPVVPIAVPAPPKAEPAPVLKEVPAAPPAPAAPSVLPKKPEAKKPPTQRKRMKEKAKEQDIFTSLQERIVDIRKSVQVEEEEEQKSEAEEEWE